MLVPPAPWYRGARFVQHLVDSGFVGELREVIGFNLNANKLATARITGLYGR